MDVLRVGILGFGTVGRGVVRLLLQHANLLTQRVGIPIVLQRIATRTPDRDRGVDLAGIQVTDQVEQVTTAPDIDVVVELIGGSEPAGTYIRQALAHGKHVVTANKALIAQEGEALFAAAREAGRELLFEASVAGAIPIIKVLREGLAGNRIIELCGILNGTCNYILTEMRETGRPFEEVLKAAQEKGYAEADPSFDVDGIDTAHKLVILSAMAFGTPLAFHRAHVEGIRRISREDILWATEMGYRIKLLAITKSDPEKGLELRVHPTLVPMGSMLAAVEGVHNAVLVVGDYAGSSLHYGRGAGESPTASAVVADLVDLARNLKAGAALRVPQLSHLAEQCQPLPMRSMDDLSGQYYLRLSVEDRPGVLADITVALRNHGVSIDAFHQKGRSPAKAVPVVIVTHETTEKRMMSACQEISQLPAVVDTPHLLRIENIPA